MNREHAFELVTKHIKDTSLINHALETEAVMRGLARHFEADQELWGVTGLLHDLDFELTRDTPEEHGLQTCRELEGQLPPEAIQAIAAHNSEMNGTQPETTFDFALRCGETATGLISANALVRPEGMQDMKPKSLKKKMKDKSFAANVDRDRIKECDRIGLELGAFFQIAIEAMTEIAPQVGLDKA